MTVQEITSKINQRINEMLLNQEIKALYDSKPKDEADQWIFNQACFTLMYSHEERLAISKD